MIVLDASVAIAWAFSEATSDAITGLRGSLGVQGAVVPQLWFSEVANVVVMAERRGGQAPHVTDALIRAFLSLPIQPDLQPAAWIIPKSAELARRHRLTIYDATYLELALRMEAPLATLDRELQAAALNERVPLIR